VAYIAIHNGHPLLGDVSRLQHLAVRQHGRIGVRDGHIGALSHWPIGVLLGVSAYWRVGGALLHAGQLRVLLHLTRAGVGALTHAAHFDACRACWRVRARWCIGASAVGTLVRCCVGARAC